MHNCLKSTSAAIVLMFVSLAGINDSAAAAETTLLRGCEVAREYIRLTDDGEYDQVGELWVDNAVFYNPVGEIIRGKPAIKSFYSRFLRTITPVNRVSTLAWDPVGNVCVMEIETRVVKGKDGKWMPDSKGNFQRTAIDRFIVNDDGMIEEMRVYLAPPMPWLNK